MYICNRYTIALKRKRIETLYQKRTLNKNHMTKNFKWAMLTLLAALTLTACGGDDDDDNKGGSETPKVKNVNANIPTKKEYSRLEFPKLKGGTSMVLIKNCAPYGVNYSVEWDTSKKSQRWSCYQMHNGNSGSGAKRYGSNKNDPRLEKYGQYPQDPDLPSSQGWTPKNDPFYGSGYDHGHIVASADRLCSDEMNFQTFYLTNMQPQRNTFNAGIWEKMEVQVRNWNKSSFRDTLYVCKGGTIDKPDQILKTTGKGLLVPKYFFMAVLCKNSQGYKAMAFWVEHLDEDHSLDNLKNYFISVDQLEELTGIDFFCNLPDDIETKVEGQNMPNAWGFK